MNDSLLPNIAYLQVGNKVELIKKITGVDIRAVKEGDKWKIINPEKDEITKRAKKEGKGGYYIEIEKEVKMPISACFFLGNVDFQAPHNVIKIKKGGKAVIYNGCFAPIGKVGIHAGITEIEIEENASLDYIMIHSWRDVERITPRTAIKCKGNLRFFYFLLSSPKYLHSIPEIEVEGGKVEAFSILIGKGDSQLISGVKARGEGNFFIGSRVIAKDTTSAKTTLEISCKGKSRGHAFCDAISLSKYAKITAEPILEGCGNECFLSHEAAIGKIAEDQINYLRMKGFDERTATLLLIKGFLSPQPHFPEKIKNLFNYVERIVVGSF